MKQILSIIALLFCAIAVDAQKEEEVVINTTEAPMPKEEIKAEIADPKISVKDSTFYLHDKMSWMYSYYPIRYGLGYTSWGMPWGLHKGLNLSLDFSVFGSFGKNAPKDAGFGQTLSALYVYPVNDHITLIGGGYFNNTYYSYSNYREGGLYGEMSYRFNNHWEASVYGQKSIMNNDAARWIPRSLFMSERMGDRIGASVRYNFSPGFSVQLNMEYQNLPRIRGRLNPVAPETSFEKP